MLLLTLLEVIVFYKFIEVVLIKQLLKVKRCTEGLPQVIDFIYCAVLQKLHEMQKLIILLIMLEWNDWNAVAQLKPKAIDGIVDQDHVLHVNIFDHAEVFDIHIISCFYTTVSV